MDSKRPGVALPEAIVYVSLEFREEAGPEMYM